MFCRHLPTSIVHRLLFMFSKAIEDNVLFQISRKDFDGFKKLFHRFLQVKGPSVEWAKINRPPEESVSTRQPACLTVYQSLGWCNPLRCSPGSVFVRHQSNKVWLCCAYTGGQVHKPDCGKRSLKPDEDLKKSLQSSSHNKSRYN